MSRVEANPLTGNVLLIFEPHTVYQEELIAKVAGLRHAPVGLNQPSAPVVSATPAPRPLAATPRRRAPSVVTEASGPDRRARISVRGLDRDPNLVGRLVRHLREHHGIRALARPLTGHVLIEYDHRRVLLEHILATIAHLELPDLPGEDHPRHPLDTAPLAQGLVRVLGSLAGLAFLTVRRLRLPGATAHGTGLASTVAGVINLAQGFPLIRTGLRRLLGEHATEMTSIALGIVAQAVANFPLAIIVTGVEGLVLLAEVTTRRSAWRRYEESLHGSVASEPGAMIRLEAGARVPCAARVVEGTGTAVCAGGLPIPLMPGTLAPGGAEVYGGPYVLELVGGEPFEPEPRPDPPTPTLYDQYQRAIGPLAVGFAAFTALRTLSAARTFEALLLLNPRAALIGLEAANLGAAARVLRAGLTVVGTRPDRVVQRPDVVLLHGSRLLTDGLEIAALLALEKPSEAPNVLALAAAVSAAAGSPWGHAFPPPAAGLRQ